MTAAVAFLDQVRGFLGLTLTHALVMFPYITLPPFLLSPLLQGLAQGRARARVLRNPGGMWRAVWLGICSPPGRSKIFGEADALFASGVSPANVLAYVVSAHSFIVYFPLLIVALSGPQPVIGLALTALLSIAVLRILLRRIPAAEWEKARTALADRDPPPGGTSAAGGGRRVLGAFVGDLRSLWWPLLLGATLGAVIAAWGLSAAFFSIQGDRGLPAQTLSAVVGALLAYLSGVPPVGNVYLAAWLWKTEFFTYAGLMAFYLGALVTPFALPRYAELFGRALAWRVIRRVLLAVLLSALVVTGFWYALDGLLHAVGLAAPIEKLLGSTIEPSAIPWFHRLFWRHVHGM